MCFSSHCAGQAPTVQSCAQQGKKTTIRIGSPFKPGHILVDAAEKFKELIEKGSGGRIAVEMQVGVKSEEEINDLCSKGTIEMQSNGNRPLEIYAPQYFFLGAPYVLKDWDHFMRVWQGNLGKKAREQVEKNGNVKLFGNCLQGPSPDDIKETSLYASRRLWFEASIARRTDVGCGMERNRC